MDILEIFLANSTKLVNQLTSGDFAQGQIYMKIVNLDAFYMKAGILFLFLTHSSKWRH